jgi:hypothetical protein
MGKEVGIKSQRFVVMRFADIISGRGSWVVIITKGLIELVGERIWEVIKAWINNYVLCVKKGV